MNRTLKITIVLSALLGLAAGATVGVYFGKMEAELIQMVDRDALDSPSAGYATMQFQHADAEHARSALLFRIRVLGQMIRLDPNSAARSRLWIAYTRLGIVEESAGQAAAAHAAFDSARASIKESNPGHRMSDEQLRNALLQMEQELEEKTRRLDQEMDKPSH